MFAERLAALFNEQERKIKTRYYASYADPAFIPIHLTGGIGDVIAARPVLEKLSGEYRIACYSAHYEAFNYFSETLKALPEPMPNFSWHLEFNVVARFRFTDQFDGFLIPAHQELFQSQKRIFQKSPIIKTFVTEHPHHDAALARYSQAYGLNRIDFPLYSLGLDPYVNIVRPTRLRVDPVITLHDGYDTTNWSDISGRATKQWKWEHWNRLVQMLKKEFPHLQICQLGAKTGREIDGVDYQLINKTTITEAFDILKRSMLHIDGDSGLVHAATSLKVPCVVMFGPTPDYFYGYPENTNLRANTCADACYWLTDNWMTKCPIGHSGPKCMDEITPEQVFGAARARLK